MAAKPQRGMLVSFTQPDAEHEAEHNEWFNREHVDERVFTPGFTRSRRYEAIDAPFKYFATYETETADVLSSDAYLKVVSNQSDWSKRVIAAVAASPPGIQPVVDGQLIEPGYLDVARRVAEAAKWPRLA